MVLGPQAEGAFDLVANVAPGSAEDLFLILGLDFMQEVNGVMYPLKNGAFNPLAIVGIEEA